MSIPRRGHYPVIRAVLCALCAISASAAERTLFSFSPYHPDGANPHGTLLRDAAGALYGATTLGGAYYNGTIFKLTPPALGRTDWTLSTIYTFTGGSDGGTPNGGLVMDSTGAIYGTASSGGSWLNQGLVFKLTPAPGTTQWKQTVIHYFYHSYAFGADDGANPSGGLIMDRYGALYGVTNLGGSIASVSGSYGTVFKLAPLDAARTNWQETVLYRFQGGADGANPFFQLALDAAGALYGSTLYGGKGACADFFSNVIGCGTVYKLTPPAPGQSAWMKTTLHSFTGGVDGNVPQGRLLLDYYGNVYGTTIEGGAGRCTDSLYNVVGCGIVYELTPPGRGQTAWTESILHSFTGPDGAFPQGGLLIDAAGALYGTTSGGGPASSAILGSYGLVFKLSRPTQGGARWTQTILYSFDISTSGDTPIDELTGDPFGNLFGVAHQGGPHLNGTVFQISR
jgi:hypothetical protein